VLLCLLFAGIAEVIGMGTLLPLASQLSGGLTENSSPMNQVIMDGIAWFGIPSTLGSLITVVAAFLAVKAVLTFSALSYAGISAAKVAVNVRRRLINAVFDARWGYYSNQSGGKFANTLSVDSTRSGEAYLLAAQTIARATQVVAYAAIAFFIDWRIASIALVAGVVIMLFFSSLITAARRAGAEQNKQMQKLATLMVDVMASIKPLKSMSRYQKLVGGMGTLLKGMRRALVIRELSIQGMVQGSDLLIALLVGGGVYFAHSYWNTPLPELVISGVVFFQIVAATSRMQRQLQKAYSVENSYTRVANMTATARANKENQSGKQVPDLGEGCTFENVSFGHRKKLVLKNVDLEIPANQLTVLQGPSGSGKTTLIDMLIGLHRPVSGKVLIGGVPLETIDLAAWRRQIGYVPQELHLLHATVRDNVALGDPAISDEAVSEALIKAGVGGLLQRRGGLDAGVGEMGSKLSGGQRQRISIARALVTNPKLLILDEVTSALDPETEAAIVESITALKGRYTIIAVTHRPAWTRAADRLYQIEKQNAALLHPAVAAPKRKPAARKVKRARKAPR
jgi:ATP-binding cassette subfamily C protein